MNDELSELLSRLREGDSAAAARLVAAYEPEVRRFIRIRMTSPQMRRLVESVDISQSVFAKFFVDIHRGTVCPESTQQLRTLLLTMARNKTYDYVRRHNAAKRDVRRVDATATALEQAYYEDETSSDTLAAEEMLAAVRAEMTGEELELVDARLAGRSWSEIATAFGGSPESARKRVTRIIESTAKRVGARA
jgi:RNA polymerase sigma factor (sigma-70 family)